MVNTNIMPPPIALTIGEPAGIGPELVKKAYEAIGDQCPFFVIADPNHLPSDCEYVIISDPSEAKDTDKLPVLVHDFKSAVTPGRPVAEHARHVIEVIERAVSLTMSGQALAVCTNPICKQALIEGAGFGFPGHTEFLASLAGGADVAMMLACDELRVVPATIHIALSQVPKSLTASRLTQVISTTHQALISDFGIQQPRIAIAGLNPHAGEGGTMGEEEIALIAPVLEAMRQRGITLIGPLPADTMFHKAARQNYDAAICMYHDQALIPIKTLDFSGGVNVTLGLPFVRTSPDHGTAFDIAGQNIADATSLTNALLMAQKLGLSRWRKSYEHD